MTAAEAFLMGLLAGLLIAFVVAVSVEIVSSEPKSKGRLE